MDILLMVLAFLLLVASIIGCVLPVLPGVPLAYAGMLLLHLTDKIHFTTPQLVIWLILEIQFPQIFLYQQDLDIDSKKLQLKDIGEKFL